MYTFQLNVWRNKVDLVWNGSTAVCNWNDFNNMTSIIWNCTANYPNNLFERILHYITTYILHYTKSCKYNVRSLQTGYTGSWQYIVDIALLQCATHMTWMRYIYQLYLTLFINLNRVKYNLHISAKCMTEHGRSCLKWLCSSVQLKWPQ